jgi:hypothetical protein
VANVLGQGQDLEVERYEKILYLLVLLFVLGALEKFHVGLNRQVTFFNALHQARRLYIASLNPNEYVRIKEHRSDLCGADQ